MISQLYDFRWTFSDGHTVTFVGVGRFYDLRMRLKEYKRKDPVRGRRLTQKSMDIIPHTFCNLCRPCTTCKRPLHVCDGHEEIA